MFLPKNKWLLLIFIVYIALIFLFGQLYYLIFKAYPNSFLFNSEIVLSQKKFVNEFTNYQLVDINLKLDFLETLMNSICSNNAELIIDRVYGKVIFSNIKIDSIDYEIMFFKARKGVFGKIENCFQTLFSKSYISIEDKNIIIKDLVDETSECNKTLLMFCNREIENYKLKQIKLIRKINNINTLSNEVWSYFDFLYFSAITQATVGYGDILPNNTLIRMIIVFQIIISMSLITVVINFTLRNKNDTV